MRTTSKARQIAIDTDTALAAQYEELAKLARNQTAAYGTLHRVIGDRRVGFSKWALTDETAYFEASHKVDEAEDPTGQVERALENLVAIETDIDLANERIAELDRVYADHGGWNRYFLVTNNNGHVHRGMGCSTCFPTTEYAWLVELADCDEAEMITEFGEKACTVCFPDAPANPHFNGPGRRDAEALAARQAEKDARQAAKDIKRLADDEVFRTSYGHDRVETVAACKDLIRRAVDTAEELKAISTPAFAASYPGDIARFIANVTDILAQQQQDAEQAKRVLLSREVRHEGWGATHAQIDKIIASKAKAAAKTWAKA